MATLDDSPSLFSGKPWTVWSDKVEGKHKTEIKDEDAGMKAKDGSDAMKLRKDDMPLYGLCPARDEFYLVVCECCEQVIKPQALRRHIEQRHGNLPSPKTSPLAGSKSSSHGHSSAHGSSKVGLGTTSSGRERSSQSRHAKNKMGPSRSGDSKVNNSLPVVELERIQSPLIKKSDKIKSSSPLSKTETATTSTVTTSTAASISSGPLLSMPATLSPLLSPTATTTTTMTTASTSVRAKASRTHGKSSPSGSAHSAAPPLVPPPSAMTSASSNPSSLNSSTNPVTSTPSTKTMPNPATTLSSGTSTSRSSSSTTNSSNASVSSSNTTTSTPARKVLPSLAHFPKPEKLLPCKDRQYDPNKHCGVFVPEDGKPCTRSLTCKAHALSLRRKVEGRRKTFDDLLKEHKEVKEAMLKAKLEMKAAAEAAKGKGVASSAAAQLTSPPLAGSVTTTAMTAIQSPPGGAQTQTTSTRGGSSSASPSTKHSSQIQSPLAQAAKVAVERTFPNTRLHVTSPRPVPLPVVPITEPTPPPETCSHLSSDGEDDMDESRDQCGYPHLAYHPRPAAVNTFGARLSGGGCFVFSRKTDLLHAAFKAAVERHLHPPPHKKLCVESRLPQGSHISTNVKDPYEFGAGESSLGWGSGKLSGGKTNKPKSSATSPSVSRTIKPKDIGVKSPNSLGMPMTVTSPPAGAGVTLCKTPPGVNSNSGGSNLKRKRSGSSPSPATSHASLPGNIAVNASVSSPISIAIPTASLNLSLGNPGLANLNAALSTRPQQLPGNKNSFLKDFNIVVTSMDPNVVNGQLVSIPGPNLGEMQHIQLNHLAETAKTSKASAKQRTLTSLKSNAPVMAQNTVGGIPMSSGPIMMDSSPTGAALGHMAKHTGIVVTSAHVSTPQASPSTTPSPLFPVGSTSPQVSATSPLPNGIMSPPSGLDLKSFTVNHLAPPGGRFAGVGGVASQHLPGAAPVITVAEPPLQQQQNSGSHSRAKGGSRSSNSLHKQHGNASVGRSHNRGTPPVGVGMVGPQQMFTALGKNQVVVTGAPAMYSRQILNTSKFSHIQIQPKAGGGKTITAGKLAVHPVSLTIPIVTTPGVATSLAPPPAQTRALILPTEDHHKRDLSQNSSHNVLS